MNGFRLRLSGRQVCYVTLAAITLGQAGCLVAAVGAGAAGAGAAGYFYAQGKVCDEFSASFDEAWAATLKAMGELSLPIKTQLRDTNLSGDLESVTSDGEAIRIHIETRPAKIPADGSISKICVRVGTWGDYPVSEKIIHQVSAHLAPPKAVPVPSQAWSGPPPSQPASVEPPLLGAPEPVKR
jgi:hypothetical protein